MKINQIKETAVFEGIGYWDSLTLTAEDVKSAAVGDKWGWKDQDAPTNRKDEWWNEVTILFKDERGALLRIIYAIDSLEINESTELRYIEFI